MKLAGKFNLPPPNFMSLSSPRLENMKKFSLDTPQFISKGSRRASGGDLLPRKTSRLQRNRAPGHHLRCAQGFEARTRVDILSALRSLPDRRLRRAQGVMVLQGSLHEEDGKLPDWPYVWDSDDTIPRTPDHEEFSPHEVVLQNGDSNSDEDLMYKVSGCPTVRRLQRVTLRHKHSAYGLQLDLVRERAVVARLEVLSQEQGKNLRSVSTNTVNLALERDEARKLARRWKLCACVLGLIVSVCVLAA